MYATFGRQIPKFLRKSCNVYMNSRCHSPWIPPTQFTMGLSNVPIIKDQEMAQVFSEFKERGFCIKGVSNDYQHISIALI